MRHVFLPPLSTCKSAMIHRPGVTSYVATLSGTFSDNSQVVLRFIKLKKAEDFHQRPGNVIKVMTRTDEKFDEVQESIAWIIYVTFPHTVNRAHRSYLAMGK